jgi:hypothetical protein
LPSIAEFKHEKMRMTHANRFGGVYRPAAVLFLFLVPAAVGGCGGGSSSTGSTKPANTNAPGLIGKWESRRGMTTKVYLELRKDGTARTTTVTTDETTTQDGRWRIVSSGQKTMTIEMKTNAASDYAPRRITFQGPDNFEMKSSDGKQFARYQRVAQ